MKKQTNKEPTTGELAEWLYAACEKGITPEQIEKIAERLLALQRLADDRASAQSRADQAHDRWDKACDERDQARADLEKCRLELHREELKRERMAHDYGLYDD